MKFTSLIIPIVTGSLLLASCDKQSYEECAPNRIFGSWGVVNTTNAFGTYDSLYYVINPVRDILDSIFYNGNYTDSYYKADNTRVTLRYTTSDSIFFHIDRLYKVQSNPMTLKTTVTAPIDTTHITTTLTLHRDSKDENLYRCGPDSLFKVMLAKGHILRFFAINTASSSEAAGSQNYEWVIYTGGFNDAFEMANALNGNKKTVRPDTLTVKQKSNIFTDIGKDLGVPETHK